MASPDRTPSAATVYCKWCNKTHTARPDEQECGFPGTWSFEEPITFSEATWRRGEREGKSYGTL